MFDLLIHLLNILCFVFIVDDYRHVIQTHASLLNFLISSPIAPPPPALHPLLLLLLSRFSHVHLCANPIDGSPPGSTIPGVLQARTLEWIAIAFSNA